MGDFEARLPGIVNSSGFPLQLGLERLVQETQREHGWHFLSREHPWRNEIVSGGGFIDLIIENQPQTQAMVIECKRVRDTAWIFLVPNKDIKHRRHANAWLHWKRGPENSYFDWEDLTLDPVSPESEFCVIPGHDPKSRPMLERTAAELIDATEALALEERSLSGYGVGPLRIYFSVIITTAELKVCNFDPVDIDIRSGEIENSCFSTVPFVRFRKCLSTRPPMNSKFKNIAELGKATERTVFIVNSGSVLDFLKSWELNWPP